MAILTVIQYTPKVSNDSAPQLPAKPLWTDSRKEPVRLLPISRAAGNSDWQKGPSRDSGDTAQVIQGVRADKNAAGDQVMPNDGADDDLPSLNRFFARYKRKLPAEEPGVKSSAEGGDDLDSGLLYPEELRAESSIDDPIELHGTSKLDNDDAKARHCPRTLYNGPMDHDVMDLEAPSAPSDRLADEDGKGSTEDINSSNCAKSPDDDVSSKRQELSAPAGVETILNGYNAKLIYSPSVILEDEEVMPRSTPDHSNLGSTAKPTPVAFESASLIGAELCSRVIDADQDWEVRKIIGREYIDGIPHYLVDWHPTLEPEHLLGHAKELVDEFKARLEEDRGVKDGGGLSTLKIKQKATWKVTASGSRHLKRQRGRPRNK